MDTNVLVGGYSGDARYQKDADCLHYLFALTGKKLYISTLSVAQLISMFQKKHTNEEVIGIVHELQHRFTIIDFTTMILTPLLLRQELISRTMCSTFRRRSRNVASS